MECGSLYRADFISCSLIFIYISDIDFEYPSNTAQGQGFAALLTSLRTAFDQLATKKGDTVPYQITVNICAYGFKLVIYEYSSRLQSPLDPQTMRSSKYLK